MTTEQSAQVSTEAAAVLDPGREPGLYPLPYTSMFSGFPEWMLTA